MAVPNALLNAVPAVERTDAVWWPFITRVVTSATPMIAVKTLATLFAALSMLRDL
jgi:hypothetical protein